MKNPGGGGCGVLFTAENVNPRPARSLHESPIGTSSRATAKSSSSYVLCLMGNQLKGNYSFIFVASVASLPPREQPGEFGRGPLKSTSLFMLLFLLVLGCV